MDKDTDIKCNVCNKSIGKLDVNEKPVFKSLINGVVEYNGLFCSDICYKRFAEDNKEKVSLNFWQWLNEWGNFNKHEECSNSKFMTEYGKGYEQAIRDVFERIKHDVNRDNGD